MPPTYTIWHREGDDHTTAQVRARNEIEAQAQFLDDHPGAIPTYIGGPGLVCDLCGRTVESVDLVQHICERCRQPGRLHQKPEAA